MFYKEDLMGNMWKARQCYDELRRTERASANLYGGTSNRSSRRCDKRFSMGRV